MNGSGRNLAGCATCAGECCRKYRVEITYLDVRELATGMDLDPIEFVRPLEDESGFRLRPGGPGYSLYLKRDEKGNGCVFLMELAPGKARCGVYHHRPLTCSNFPAKLSREAGTVEVRQDTLCGPDSWNLAAMDLTGYRRDLVRGRAQWARHLRIVEAWNTAMEIKGRTATFRDLLDFLSNPERTEKAEKALERRKAKQTAAKAAAEAAETAAEDELTDEDEQGKPSAGGGAEQGAEDQPLKSPQPAKADQPSKAGRPSKTGRSPKAARPAQPADATT